MKKTFLFCTKFSLYIIELPLVFLLTLSIIFHSHVESPLGLIPFIVALCAMIVFIFLYLFRLVIISQEEIRQIGVYSSKDRAIINKDKTIVLTLKKHGRILCELYGKDDTPSLEWLSSEDFKDEEINLFRAKAVGTLSSIKRVMSYFEIPKEDIKQLLTFNNVEKEYDSISVICTVENEFKTVRIKFLKTL